MGIPADVSWTVVRGRRRDVVLRGEGPMGLSLGIRFASSRRRPVRVSGSTPGMSGDPVARPDGRLGRAGGAGGDGRLPGRARGAAVRSGVAGSRRRALRCCTVRAAGTLDPRTPVIVGAGQVVQRDARPDARTRSRSPPRRCARAEQDSGVDRAARSRPTRSTPWRAPPGPTATAAALVAEQVGASPGETVQSARFGGDAGQVLVNAAGAGDRRRGGGGGPGLPAPRPAPRWPSQRRTRPTGRSRTRTSSRTG